VQFFRILVVDDFKPFRDVVCEVLQERRDFYVVGKAADGLQAIELAQKLQPDLILMDIGLPKLNGIEAAKCIRTLSPNSLILFCTQISSCPVIAEAFRLGAQGYLLKIDAAGELESAVDEILEGRQYVSSHLGPVYLELH